MKVIGRNTPCPCGSGKKYKRCCGLNAADQSAEQITEMFERALQLHQSGNLQEAAELYRQILQRQPRHADALHLLGLICHQQGDHNKAIDLINQAIVQNDRAYIFFNSLGNAYRAAGNPGASVATFRKAMSLAPNSPEVHSNLGMALYEHGLADEALEHFQRAIALDPNFPDVHFALGNALKALGKTGEAIASYQRCIELQPNYADAHYNLANLLTQQGKHAEAIDTYQHALALRPQHAEAWFNLGSALKANSQLNEAIDAYMHAIILKPDFAEAHCFLGELYFEQNKPAEAEECFKRALTLKPSDSKAHNAYGKLLNQQGQIEATIAHYEAAIASDPRNAVAYCNLGMMRNLQGNTDEAIRCLQRAISIQPGLAQAHYNLALMHENKGHCDQAVKIYQHAIKANPDYAEAHWNRSLVLLRKGQIKEGWEEHEWRWRSADFPSEPRPFTYPWWDGASLKGKTILVWPEQGIGDEIMFGSALPDLINAAGHCIIECQIRLLPLYARSFPNAEVVQALNPPHPRTLEADVELQSPVGSLPRYLRPTLESFPSRAYYLIPDSQRAVLWKERIDKLGPGLKVGICWRSMLRSKKRNLNYTELNQWKAVLTLPGIIFVNLQYDNCQDELQAIKQELGVEIHAWDDIDLLNNLDDAAALTSTLDLVISAGTAVAAMAGALGVSVWQFVISTGWDSLGTDHLPWYPNMRLFKRGLDSEWEPVFEKMAQELVKQERSIPNTLQ